MGAGGRLGVASYIRGCCDLRAPYGSRGKSTNKCAG
jgi:hypothetical protein